MPQWKNNLCRDVSSSVDFDKKLRTRQIRFTQWQNLAFLFSSLSSTLRLDNHFSALGALVMIWFGGNEIREIRRNPITCLAETNCKAV
jgi:hypothetical protein